MALRRRGVGDSGLCSSLVEQELLGSSVINSELNVLFVDLSSDEVKPLIC